MTYYPLRKSDPKAVHWLIYEAVSMGDMAPAKKPTATIACRRAIEGDWREKTTNDPKLVTCGACARMIPVTQGGRR